MAAETNRYDSFAAVREKCHAKWFVDGKDYMEAVANAISMAESEIYITDWQLNPSIFLKRPANQSNWDEWKLENMLKNKAKKGVQVHILIYKESELAWKKFLELGTEYTQRILEPEENIHFYQHGWGIGYDFRFRIRWSHHEKVVVVDRKVAFLGGLDLCYGRWDTPEHKLNDASDDESCRLWKGLDYKNTFLMKDSLTPKDYEQPLQDFHGLDRKTKPRMPWHDVACCVFGAAAGDVARHFVQRYNKNTKDKLEDVVDDCTIVTVPGIEPSEVGKCQVLRSAEKSSTGISRTESSIYNAYLKSIEEAKHFIYIENQFFVSTVKKDERMKGVIENMVVKALADRIIRAHENKESFQMIIVIPLKPEFSGTWKDSDELKSVAYLNYSTILRGDDSFFGLLKAGGVKEEDIPNYVSFYSLRAHDTLNGELVTEVIYVHTKTMVVDDRITIIGSANINDRSMLGDRDTEIALIVEDESYSKTLRCHLTREHLGLEETDSTVDAFDQCYTQFQETAKTNTEAYESVFGCSIEESDEVTSFEKLEERKTAGLAKTDMAAANRKLSTIRGHVVMHPLHFLKEDLEVSGVFTYPIADLIVKGDDQLDRKWKQFV